MENSYIAKLIYDSSEDYTDTYPLHVFMIKATCGELKDETFDFGKLSQLTVNLYRLFVTIDKLGGSVNKKVVELILQIEKFNSLKVNEKGISLVQSMLKLMVQQFLGNTLTSKPSDPQTHKTIVFDKADKGKDYSDRYFAFVHKRQRFIVKTDTFDLTEILKQL